jgi:hypothetical protein
MRRPGHARSQPYDLFCDIDPTEAQLLALVQRMILLHSLASFSYYEGFNYARALGENFGEAGGHTFGSIRP